MPAPTVETPTFDEALRVWARIGVLSFGGPAGQIALMHRILLDERRWIAEDEFLHALNFCMLLPGPEAMQLATYIGWKLHGWRGALTAGLLFVVPGAIVILALSMIYAAYGRVSLVESVFFGIKAAVLAIVVEALLRVARRALRTPTDWLVAALAFIALFLFKVPFPAVIVAAAVYGYLRTEAASPRRSFAWSKQELAGTAATLFGWLAIWWLPVVALAVMWGNDHVFLDVALFFSKLAVVTFGGAYAVLTYMAQQAVEVYGWLTPAEMVDGLGLAETTPGPLILVTEFVGYLAGYRHGGGIAGGVLGALITLWVTFVPCFMWIMVAAPYLERLRALPRLSGSLAAITAAVVGVILNLSVWFALHVLFGRVDEVAIGPIRTSMPEITTINFWAAGLSTIAAVLLLRHHLNVMLVLAICGTLGLLIG